MVAARVRPQSILRVSGRALTQVELLEVLCYLGANLSNLEVLCHLEANLSKVAISLLN